MKLIGSLTLTTLLLGSMWGPSHSPPVPSPSPSPTSTPDPLIQWLPNPLEWPDLTPGEWVEEEVRVLVAGNSLTISELWCIVDLQGV